MKFFSTGSSRALVDLRTAVLTGMPRDGGLYLPVEIPRLPATWIEERKADTLLEVSRRVAELFFRDDLPPARIADLVGDAINFPAPLVELAPGIRVLELFHGPTLAFKDFGARFMARLMAHLVKDDSRKLNVLVATSGDTGGAVANGFFGVEGINVLVLYPAGKVSKIQEKQIATPGGNITPIRVKGTFDDCQRLVKRALSDPVLAGSVRMTSANSINISRLIPQIFYYVWIFFQLPRRREIKIAVSVPSGNLGNLTAGLMAQKMGLPVIRWMAATNINDSLVRYLNSGRYQPRPSVPTISNAMDVGDPSNFQRILELYGHRHRGIIRDIQGRAYTDGETRQALGELYRSYRYIGDPHGAVAYQGLRDLMNGDPRIEEGIFLETAHPAKFPETVEQVIPERVSLPSRLNRIMNQPIRSVNLSCRFTDFRDLLASSSLYR